MRRRRGVRQPEAEPVGRTDRPRLGRIHQRNHSPGRHGGQARRHVAAAQRPRHAGRSRLAGRPGQGAGLPRARVPQRHPRCRATAQRNRIVRSRRLSDRGKGQASGSGLAGRACGRRRDGSRLPVRPDEKPAGRCAAAVAQVDAVGAAAQRPDLRRGWRATSATCRATSARRRIWPSAPRRSRRNWASSARCWSAASSKSSRWDRSSR